MSMNLVSCCFVAYYSIGFDFNISSNTLRAFSNVQYSVIDSSNQVPSATHKHNTSIDEITTKFILIITFDPKKEEDENEG